MLATNIDNKWRINDLRDYTIDNTQPVWSNSWIDISSDYWIDKIPNNIDYSKPLFNIKRFRDYYLGVRLFTNNSNNYKFNTDIIQTYTANRIR